MGIWIFIIWVKLKWELSIKMNRIVMNEERQLTSLKRERNPNNFIGKLPFSENGIGVVAWDLWHPESSAKVCLHHHRERSDQSWKNIRHKVCNVLTFSIYLGKGKVDFRMDGCLVPVYYWWWTVKASGRMNSSRQERTWSDMNGNPFMGSRGECTSDTGKEILRPE